MPFFSRLDPRSARSSTSTMTRIRKINEVNDEHLTLDWTKHTEDSQLTWLCTDEPVKKGFITSERARSWSARTKLCSAA